MTHVLPAAHRGADLPCITAFPQASYPNGALKTVNRVIHKAVAEAKSRAVPDPESSAKLLNGMLQQQSDRRIFKHNMSSGV